jgi:hypothetical protein
LIALGLERGRESLLTSARNEQLSGTSAEPNGTLTKTHDRHLSMEKAVEIGLVVMPLEENQTLQDLVLSVHHACIHALTETGACKIIENHRGAASILVASPN